MPGAAYDVVVVGGGVAGLSAALVLGRARRRVVVIDAGRPRNTTAPHVQGFLTQEGTPPQELVARARREVAAYGVELRTGTAVAARGPAAGFEVVTDDGATLSGRHLLLATGLEDRLPLPGLDERWGRDVLHCPYCHGWEVRDRRIVLLGESADDAQEALLLRQWSARTTLLLPDPSVLAPHAARLAARGVSVVAGRATGVEVRDDALTAVRLEGGERVPADALFVRPEVVERSDLALSLGADVDPQDQRLVLADECGRSSVPGLWVVGSLRTPVDQVADAVSAGNRTAIAVNLELVEADADGALAASSAPGGEAQAT